jgi:hypothetical protein
VRSSLDAFLLQEQMAADMQSTLPSFSAFIRPLKAAFREHSMEQMEEQAAAAHGMALRMAEMEIELRMTRMMLDDVKTDRDRWRDMAESAQRLLTDQRATPRPTGASAPRPPEEPHAAAIIEKGIESGMAEIRRRLESLRAKAGH